MSTEKRIEARIESEFETKRSEPHPNGDKTVKVTISSSGLTVEEVLNHRWVKDAYQEDNGIYTVHVKADSEIHVTVT